MRGTIAAFTKSLPMIFLRRMAVIIMESTTVLAKVSIHAATYLPLTANLIA